MPSAPTANTTEWIKGVRQPTPRANSALREKRAVGKQDRQHDAKDGQQGHEQGNARLMYGGMHRQGERHE